MARTLIVTAAVALMFATPALAQSTSRTSTTTSSTSRDSTNTTKKATKKKATSQVRIRNRSNVADRRIPVEKDTAVAVVPAAQPDTARPAPLTELRSPVYPAPLADVALLPDTVRPVAATPVAPVAIRHIPTAFYAGIGAGGLLPRGAMQRDYNAGAGMIAFAGWQPLPVLGLQLDAGVGKLNGDTPAVDCAQYTNSSPNVAHLGLNGRLQALRAFGRKVGVYVTGGAARYRITNYNGSAFNGVDCTCPPGYYSVGVATETVYRNGVNAGAGLEFNVGKTHLFAESRWVRMNTNDTFNKSTDYVLPLTFGVTFR